MFAEITIGAFPWLLVTGLFALKIVLLPSTWIAPAIVTLFVALFVEIHSVPPVFSFIVAFDTIAPLLLWTRRIPPVLTLNVVVFAIVVCRLLPPWITRFPFVTVI